MDLGDITPKQEIAILQKYLTDNGKWDEMSIPKTVAGQWEFIKALQMRAMAKAEAEYDAEQRELKQKMLEIYLRGKLRKYV